MPKIEPIVPQDKRVIEALMSALMPFNDFQTQMPLAYMLSFLAVVREEGKPIGVYARELDLERFIIGRYFQAFLGDRGRHATPAPGLEKLKRTQAHQFKTEVHLTAKEPCRRCASGSELSTLHSTVGPFFDGAGHRRPAPEIRDEKSGHSATCGSVSAMSVLTNRWGNRPTSCG